MKFVIVIEELSDGKPWAAYLRRVEFSTYHKNRDEMTYDVIPAWRGLVPTEVRAAFNAASAILEPTQTMRPITDPEELCRLRVAAVEMFWLLMHVNALSLDECSRNGAALQAQIHALLERLGVKP